MTEAAEARNALIESRMSAERSAEITITAGANIQNLAQAFEIAKAMAISGPCVPSYLRGNPGSCLFIIMRADRWGIDPFALAEKSYMVENKGEQRIAFESQVFRAVVESLAPLQGRLTHRYEGAGDDRVCIVSGKLKGDIEVREHRSPTLGKRRPEKNDYGKTKGSPLWDSKPDVQLLYDTQRDWVRMNCPDVVMGVYTRDEMEEAGFEVVQSLPAPAAAADNTGLLHRLSVRAAAAAGFDATAVAATIDEASGRAPAVEAAPVQTTSAVPPSSPLETTAAMEVEAAPQPHVDSPPPPAAGAADSSEPSVPNPDESAAAPAAGNSSAGAVEPEPPIVSAPVVPKDGRSYVAYVKAMLEMPGFGVEANVRDWWSKGRRLRTEIPNLSPEDADEAKRLVTEHIAKLKKVGEGA